MSKKRITPQLPGWQKHISGTTFRFIAAKDEDLAKVMIEALAATSLHAGDVGEFMGGVATCLRAAIRDILSTHPEAEHYRTFYQTNADLSRLEVTDEPE